MKRSTILTLATALPALALAAACTSGGEDKPAASAGGAPTPAREALTGPARPALLLTQAWFYKDADGKSKPGPARLDIWRETDGRWGHTRLEDADSNVFHKAIPWAGGILTIGAERALLKKWTFADGKWNEEVLWEGDWGGRFDRLRDIEIGDVTGDGKDELVIATHDAGVVAVVTPQPDGTVKVLQMDEKADTFVHEIEIGDIDGDGTNEFFCTPSDRNKANAAQAGGIAMYKWDGSTFVRSWVEHSEGTHAKEILAHDMDGDGTTELFGVFEAEVDPNNKARLVKPVEIRQYKLSATGGFTHTTIATIDDRQTRFLVAGDFDGDGTTELIAAALRTGIYHITPTSDGGRWKSGRFETDSSGFEHAIYGADLDGNGRLELYCAADDQHKLRRYVWEGSGFQRTELGNLDADVFTWNITTGKL